MRGERDPNLLASFGLFEHASQRNEKAKKLLEAAVAGKTTRARAYAELALMRVEAGMQKPAAPDGKLSQTQTASVLDAAFEAREHPPALPETYEAIADAWTLCVVAPKRQHLAVLDEGVRFFPNNSTLIYKIASLKVQRGFAEDAAPLIDHGLKIAKDPSLKEKFEELKNAAKAAPAAPVNAAPTR
jgi:hypothetical protein